MKRIRAPNGDILQFPDNMPDAQIAAVIQREYGTPQQVNAAQGMLGAAMGGQQAAAGVQRQPTPVKSFSLFSQVPGEYTMGDRINDLFGFGPQDMNRPVPQSAANSNPAMSTGEDMGRSAAAGGLQGLTGLAGQFGNAVDMVGNASGWAANRFGGGGQAGDAAAQQSMRDMLHQMPVFGQMPSSAPFDAKVQQATGAYHQPQTEAGKWSQRVAGMWPAAIGGRGVVPRLASVAVPGTASYAASELAPAGYKDAAGIAAAILSGVGTGAALGRSPPGAAMLADKTPEMMPAQRAAVVDALTRGREVGLQPTLTEAIDATVPGARTTMLQQYAEGTPEGIQVLGPRMAARPQQMRSVVNKIADLLAPETSPTQLETDASAAANGAITRTRGQVNAPATPFYDAMKGETVPSAEWAQLQQNPAFTQGLNDLRSNPILNRDYAHLPDNSAAVVNEAMKRIQARTVQATPTPANPSSDATLAGAYTHQGGEVNGLMRGVSPNWAQARDIVAQGRQTLLTPQQEGPLGSIAGKPGQPAPDFNAMAEALLPSKPLEGQPGVTADALSAMDYEHPGISGQMLRAFLQRQAAESGQLVAGKPNQFAPSNFSTNVGGNPIQRANLLGATGNASPQAGSVLADALDAFDATGRRQAVGSNTVDKNAISATAESGGKVANAVIGGGGKRVILDRLFGWWSDLRISANRDKIVQAVNANPKRAAEILEQIEAARGNTTLQRSLLTGMLAGASSAGRDD